MDTKSAKGPFTIRFAKGDEDNLEQFSQAVATDPQIQPPKNTSEEPTSWRRDFLQSSFFNRKRSASIERLDAFSSAASPAVNNINGGPAVTAPTGGVSNVDTWTRIKGKVNQAMGDIKLSQQQRDIAKLSIQSTQPTAGKQSADPDVPTNSTSDEYLDPETHPYNNDSENSDNDVDSEIFNIGDEKTLTHPTGSTSKLKTSLNSFRSKQAIKTLLNTKMKDSKLTKKSIGAENEPVPPTNREDEIESGVEMVEDIVLPIYSSSTEQDNPPSCSLNEEDTVRRRHVTVPNALPIENNYSARGKTEPRTHDNRPSMWSVAASSLHTQHFIVSVGLLSILVVVPMPAFLQGVLTCLFAIFTVSMLYNTALALITHGSQAIAGKGPESSTFQVNFDQFPMMGRQPVEEHKSLKVYQGWMNEINNYDPNNYHIAMTKSVFVKLHGSRLKISNVANRVPKRAIWNEQVVEKELMVVTRNRVFDLTKCRVEMCPIGLARKRYFNRKYPIQLLIPALAELGLNKQDQIATPAIHSEDNQPSNGSSPEFIEQFQAYRDDIGTTILNADTSALRDVELEAPGNQGIPQPPCGEETRLLLFARCDREKEDWYRRFVAASNGLVTDNDVPSNVKLLNDDEMMAIRARKLLPNLQNLAEEDRLAEATTSTDKREDDGTAKEEDQRSKGMPPRDSSVEGLLMTACSSRGHYDYVKFMSTYQSKREKKETELWKGIDQSLFLGPNANVLWANVLIGRVIYSCLNDAILLEKIQDFLQKKLSAIKLPNFMEDVHIAQICLGDKPPLVHRISQPLLDERGTWIDADVTYEGLVHATVTTKLNLLRLRRQQQHNHHQQHNDDYASGTSPPDNPTLMVNTPKKVSTSPTTKGLSMSSIYDSDAESTGGSSSESENPSPTHTANATAEPAPLAESANAGGSGGSRKLLRIVERVTASNLFQSATELSYVQRAMENMSTKITLRVELKGLVSRVAINIPAPPSDRVWIGFRGPPRLWISAKPALGDHSVDWSIVTNVIESKLCEEVYKYLVYPNMVDIIVPFLGQSTYQEEA